MLPPMTDCLLPERVYSQYQLTLGEWAQQVVVLWREHQDVSKEDAIMNYLKTAQDLEMFGVAYFDIENKKGSSLYVGVDTSGLNIYAQNDKVGFRCIN